MCARGEALQATLLFAIDACTGLALPWKRRLNSFVEVEMNVPITEEQIRTLAFHLWEQDGGPEGRSEEYWEKARARLMSDNPSAEDGGRESAADV
jgi:hypothetical protein